VKINRAKAAGIILGVGLGGFADGIVLHMILRWHHMLSNVVAPDTMPGIHTNMTWDGYFHFLTWAITLAGVFVLWGVVRHQPAAGELPSTSSFTGALITGWGLFNLVEGLIDHHLLAIHNVREVPDPLPWNIGFLIIGGMMLTMVGWALMRVGGRQITVKQRSA
jgi:uncharacterized membrane protein